MHLLLAVFCDLHYDEGKKPKKREGDRLYNAHRPKSAEKLASKQIKSKLKSLI